LCVSFFGIAMVYSDPTLHPGNVEIVLGQVCTKLITFQTGPLQNQKGH